VSGPEPSNIRLYEAKFRDAITYMLAASAQPERPPETSVVEALRRLFLTAPIHVVWQTRTESLAASCADLRARGVVLRDAVRINEILALAEPLATARVHRPVTVNLTAEDAPAFGLMLTLGQDPGRLWIVLEGPRAPLSRDLLNWFSQYSQGLQEFFTVVRSFLALKATQRDASFEALARRTDAVVSGGERTFARDLEAASRLLGEIADSPDGLELRRVALAQDLAVWATQALLGVGVTGRVLPGPQGESTLVAFCEQLDRVVARALEERVSSRPREEPVVRPSELAALTGTLRALLPGPAAPPPSAGGPVEPTLHLLVTWTSINEMARRIADNRRAVQPEDDARYDVAASAAISDLAALLIKVSIANQTDAGFLRNWARLWFCHMLLRASQEGEGWWQGGLLDDEKWRFRRDLSYVLRESVRAAVYGWREDYRFQPSAFASALRTLVEHHALRVVGLPREVDIRSHLREIGEPGGPDGYHFAAGHLQHILEVYIAGHFFASMRVKLAEDVVGEERAIDGWTMGEVLASRAGWRPGTQTTLELLQASSMALLFHDTGMLLFPRYTRPSDALCRGDNRLESALGDVETRFRAAGTALVERCVEDLRSADYLDTRAEPGMTGWLEEQRASGAPDHALLGAWYLLRVARALPASTSEVVREALRAVLLHSLPTLPIDVEREPVAALLVLCDELFEWEPFVRPGPASQVPGRSMSAIAGDLRPRRSRARAISLPGLEVSQRADGAIEATLRISANDVAHGWPHVAVELHLPEHQEMAPHFIWMSMAQNLGRIDPSRHGWGPAVTISSAIPTRLRASGLNTRRLLGQLAVHSRHPSRVSLERWLFDVGRFSSDEAEGIERVELEARNHVLHSEDIRRSFGALEEDLERVLQDLERRVRSG